jgi:hypothetical protein
VQQAIEAVRFWRVRCAAPAEFDAALAQTDGPTTAGIIRAAQDGISSFRGGAGRSAGWQAVGSIPRASDPPSIVRRGGGWSKPPGFSVRPCGNVPVSVRSIRVEFAPRALIARLSG